jgi:CheY-like chemotaxis protein
MPLDVIVLDLDEMYEISPGQVVISGFRLLHLLGRLTRERPVAVVVMSSMDFAEVEGPVRASADDFVNKPIEAAQFIRRLQGALDRARTRHQQRVPVASPAWQAG